MQKQALKKQTNKQSKTRKTPPSFLDCVMDISHVPKCLAESRSWPIDYRQCTNNAVFSEMMTEPTCRPSLSSKYSNADCRGSYQQPGDSHTSSTWLPLLSRPACTPLCAALLHESTGSPAPCPARGNSEQWKLLLIAHGLSFRRCAVQRFIAVPNHTGLKMRGN